MMNLRFPPSSAFTVITASAVDAEPEKKAALLPEIAAYAVVNAVKAVTCSEAKTYEPVIAAIAGEVFGDGK